MAEDQAAIHPVDYRELPEWGSGPDGRRVRISSDERLPVLFQEWKQDACRHPRQLIVQWSNAGGQVVYKRYCYDCGTATSNFIKALDAQQEGFSEVDKDRIASIHQSYGAQREQALERIIAGAAERAQPVNRSNYDDYLRSPAWKAKVELIMRRAGQTCEGCLSRPATQVHHLTYAHIYREFAFELVALCAPCHERLHEDAA